MRIDSQDKIVLWRLSKNISNSIQQVLRSFPAEDEYGIGEQLKIKAIHIPINISEGLSRLQDEERDCFMSKAYCALMECKYLLHMAQQLDYLEADLVKKHIIRINILASKIDCSDKTSFYN